jgi:hypothetical protein
LSCCFFYFGCVYVRSHPRGWWEVGVTQGPETNLEPVSLKFASIILSNTNCQQLRHSLKIPTNFQYPTFGLSLCVNIHELFCHQLC